MADGTLIEWTDATWNPITGCSVVSPGCANCYAMRLAGPVWNGQVRLNREWLDQPLRWIAPQTANA